MWKIQAGIFQLSMFLRRKIQSFGVETKGTARFKKLFSAVSYGGLNTNKRFDAHPRKILYISLQQYANCNYFRKELGNTIGRKKIKRPLWAYLGVSSRDEPVVGRSCHSMRLNCPLKGL